MAKQIRITLDDEEFDCVAALRKKRGLTWTDLLLDWWYIEMETKNSLLIDVKNEVNHSTNAYYQVTSGLI